MSKVPISECLGKRVKCDHCGSAAEVQPGRDRGSALGATAPPLPAIACFPPGSIRVESPPLAPVRRGAYFITACPKCGNKLHPGHEPVEPIAEADGPPAGAAAAGPRRERTPDDWLRLLEQARVHGRALEPGRIARLTRLRGESIRAQFEAVAPHLDGRDEGRGLRAAELQRRANALEVGAEARARIEAALAADTPLARELAHRHVDERTAVDRGLRGLLAAEVAYLADLEDFPDERE